jgi:glycine betaine/proline transport system ATP-binding protein
MVFQQFGLLPWRSVRENVGLGLELAGLSKAERRDRVDAQLELVNLAQWADRKVGELSGGMQQRVGLARALCTDPDVLLMDEAFSALDPLIRREMQGELLRLQRELSKTIVFITHDLDEALRLGDRVAVLKDGIVVQVGTPTEIVTRPADAYVEAFVEDVDRSRVLKVRHVMTPLGPDDDVRGAAGQGTVRVSSQALLQDVVAEVAAAPEAVLAVDGEDRVVGRVEMRAVLAALARAQQGTP